MNITIKTIAHDKQRYDTVGDWWFDDEGDLQIRVSRVGLGILAPILDILFARAAPAGISAA